LAILDFYIKPKKPAFFIFRHFFPKEPVFSPKKAVFLQAVSSLLPANWMEEGYVELVSIMPDGSSFSEFANYVLTAFIESQGQ